MEIQRLRRQIKAQRQQLSRQTLKLHSQKTLRLASNYKPFRQSQRIAFYYAMRGEMDSTLLLQLALQAGKSTYLPILSHYPANRLWFAPYSHSKKFTINCFGIPEPRFKHRQLIKPWALDMVFVPLIAFDRKGHRVGMGGGYYDRTFAYRNLCSQPQGPKLIGLAHEFQLVSKLSTNPWDIPLDAVITEESIHKFRSSLGLRKKITIRN
ncbi:MAG: 5-formyltetrahydrofolate cyclo-ligase [Candidatus Thiodiazotropha sp. (ex Lucinoma aequizonata)]|nr:5-formyltetrahydrofolate cyclo-ligase [Candidatus Thiodiazotropha sp. (ex Lucinoma aequizonata)]MCU7889377.1 5-formyltetrahydrofolate cyclo-ligase [Candidatus Thiodiazotropha sp. (ex Lucinoma aequizonata)]MCU7894901.1 5-formyltetrahydrofolate cyclo-ligase [Candidatus Thiodiazotropha sp. (ex Lucinoma aequizonata)]MCU7898344.1 5-formyltetrahydrofolate cyclo-ligase [Candidatus Thiodiazotropha sp. (ex Lucinoma aequizonata)]MCU7900899.1 5-formyltetrahydrofolate cyclo-ligase [Candidatus Thiodiazot